MGALIEFPKSAFMNDQETEKAIMDKIAEFLGSWVPIIAPKYAREFVNDSTALALDTFKIALDHSRRLIEEIGQ